MSRLSVVAYALSWCVPVVESGGDLFHGRWWGWHAALFAISPLLGSDLDASWFVRIVMAGSALTNVLYLTAMARAYLRPAARGRPGGCRGGFQGRLGRGLEHPAQHSEPGARCGGGGVQQRV